MAIQISPTCTQTNKEKYSLWSSRLSISICTNAYICNKLNTTKNTAKILLELVNNCENKSENKDKIKMASILKQTRNEHIK